MVIVKVRENAIVDICLQRDFFVLFYVEKLLLSSDEWEFYIEQYNVSTERFTDLGKLNFPMLV
jgi:hypothetical protein